MFADKEKTVIFVCQKTTARRFPGDLKYYRYENYKKY